MTSGSRRDTTPPTEVDRAKGDLRRDLLRRRRRRGSAAATADGRGLTAVLLATPELGGVPAAGSVAGYLPLPGEPSPLDVLAALSARGVRVLLPVLLDDGDLDWAAAGPRGSAPDRWSVVPDRAGTTRPTGEPLGRDAVAGVDVVLVPGVAGDAAGRRLGRGGGSYDRALARLDGTGGPPGRPWTCLLLWPEELVARVPVADHDRRVDALATAAGVVRVAPPGAAPAR